MDTDSALRERLERPLLFMVHQREKVIVHKVGVPHRRGQIRVAHRLLNERRALGLEARQLRGDLAAAAEVLAPLWRAP